MVLAAVIAAVLSFFETFPDDSRAAMDYLASHRAEMARLSPRLTPAERTIAAAVVAPEVSQYSMLRDYAETKSMYVLYIYQGSGDFSIGRFQMKPRFVERLEHAVRQSASLRAVYGGWLTAIDEAPDERSRRRVRLERLESEQWQMRFLALFIDVARELTAGMTFADDRERLRYWATLYNSGLGLDAAGVARMQRRRFFPHGDRRFNYADVAAEFYGRLRP